VLVGRREGVLGRLLAVTGLQLHAVTISRAALLRLTACVCSWDLLLLLLLLLLPLLLLLSSGVWRLH
jgi:hypothetical protein